jgi:thiol-disulfide isomerase/thioredoxin
VLFSRPLTRIFLGCAAITAIISGCDRETGPKSQEASIAAEPAAIIDRSHRGAKIPEMLFKDAAGQELRLAKLTGKPILLNLWATWCAPCIAELPKLEALAQQRGASLRIITLSQDSTDLEKIAPFLAERGISALQPWLDPENTASDHYQAPSLPMTIYYDAKGREIWRMNGGHDWTNAETGKLLGEHL